MTKLHRAKISIGDPEGLGCDYTVNYGVDQPTSANDQVGQTFSTRLWELFVDPDADREDEAAFMAAKESAVAFLADVQERSPQAIKLMVHGDNAKTGDSVSAAETADPIGAMRSTWESVVDGTWRTRSGIDPAELAMINLVAERLIAVFGETKTKAYDLARDDSAKSVGRLAKKKGVPVVEYRTKLESHLAAQADL